ncbi:Repeat domain-containing protein [Mucilaginibacter mallensis]|uniref:Repeat domain-containing protein n=1 Tax=Mucilaginibacter mallensis TaxID=652787 RepID=A0A1H1PM78_MUCMA|nr:VCBS repeat-containing protein [Mucilaginibacter mallensis]SDS12253.1 Repeat domain-containing protein [Mucilaginibacter mallensis]
MRYIYLLCVSAFFITACKKSTPTLFVQLPSSETGIHFNNLITENDSINPIDNAYIYNGGGVGVGDFNNDGLQDIYFTGNMVSNRLYLNMGNFKFKDITDEARVAGMGRWARGVSVIDINNDGLMDIYVCNSLSQDSTKRTNLLYINQGPDKNGIPHFKEMAHEYGLDIHLHSTMATFFDYDNDGDLDLYIAVNEPNRNSYANDFRPVIKDGTYPSTGKLYRNDWDAKLGHPVFHDVSKQAGVTIEGYSHGVTIADINRDGWKDIYVTNDFISSNVLYINNHDGTFTDRSKEYFKHTSFNAMGQDIEDLNNDGLADVFELDMNPEDNYRKKMMSMANSYQTFQNFDQYGYQYQYVRNTLQLNQGPRVGQNDSIGAPAFSEIGFMSGVAQTDWSWTPMITDFNNDGYRDIIVTNGYPRDVTDHDFITFRNNPYLTATKKQILEQIPVVKLHNYAFKNKGGTDFEDASSQWGLSLPTFSNGAVYADLNNDGAMDMIINNIDDEALIYKNTSREKDKDHTHYLQISFVGDKQNVNGIGAWADIYYDKNKHQVYENNPFRGYLSTIQNIAHFGLGANTLIDSVVIKWSNGKKQTLQKVKADQVLKVSIANAHDNYSWQQPKVADKTLFTEVTKAKAINYKHREDDFVDFNVQKLLPHKLSDYSPALTVGDVDGNGLDDIIIGGNALYPAQVFLQQANGKFTQHTLLSPQNTPKGNYKDGGILLFDANGDGKPDLYITSSGYEAAHQDSVYQDRLYINDGKGNFTLAPGALPVNHTSKLCVRAVDYNKDGKLDLFVSGRVDPWHYPKPVSSIILRNDSKNGKVKFTDVTNEVAPALKDVGMVCDALFTDFNNDGWPDLVLAGEWMPVIFLQNDHGVFKKINTSADGEPGWWTSIVAGDFRHTGRMDYIVGNTGLNTLYQVSDQYPAYITAKDFDKRDRYDAFPSLFLPGKDGIKREYPVNVRDDAIKQMISLRVKFTNYKSYANATMDDILSPAQRKGALRLKATILQSCYFRNDGNGKFTVIALPREAQSSTLNGMLVDDFDGDGNPDVIISGNDFGTDVSIGRYDALNGLFLKGDGHGNFKPLSILQSGIYIPGNGKALVKLQGNNGKLLIAASQNRDNLKIFELKKSLSFIPLQPADMSAVIKYKNGSETKQEFYYGSSFLSQSGRFINVDKNVASVTITNSRGMVRTINLIE